MRKIIVLVVFSLFISNGCNKEEKITTWDCVNSNCIELEGLVGTYATLSGCEINCASTSGYNCNGSICDFVNNNPQHPTLEQCQSNCSGGGSNSNCNNAISISCGTTTQGVTSGIAQQIFGCNDRLNAAPGLWYRFNGQGNVVNVTTCNVNTNFDTAIGVFEGTCTGLQCVTSNDDAFSCMVSDTASSVEFTADQGIIYYIYVTGFTENSIGNFSLSITCESSGGSGYNCSNGICSYTATNAQFSTQSECQSNCSSQYPPGSVFCSSGPALVVGVRSPITGRIWMDRNLGASRVATSNDDWMAFGDLYQWGRLSDGHQCRSTAATNNLSSSDVPPFGNFILTSGSTGDWRIPQNSNLWQGSNGTNNPCPIGYRVPTSTEFNAEINSFPIENNNLARETLKLPLGGFRSHITGEIPLVGISGFYWTSTLSNTNSVGINIDEVSANVSSVPRAAGRSVRCIKN